MSASNRIVSLLICDDHKLLTDALATVVGLDEELLLIAPPVHTPEEAIRLAEEHLPNVVLMDIVFKGEGMSGIDATRRIKADPALCAIPIIAVTSYALSGDEEKARAAGCDDFVPKPFSPRQLLAKIRKYLP